MTAVGDFYLDTCTLWNFSAVDRIDLLESYFGNSARWTESVRYEIEDASQTHFHLHRVLTAAWLGETVEIEASAMELEEIEETRQVLGGRAIEPTLHLGEAEAIWLIENRAIGATFVSDDRPATNYAQRQGLSVADSQSILSDCHSKRLIGCPEAYELLESMRDDHGRGVFVPAHHSEVC